MRSLLIVLLLLVMLMGCGPRPMPRRNSDITLAGAQEVVEKMGALCCEKGWYNYLSEAEYKSEGDDVNEDEFDIGAAFLEGLEAAGARFDANEYFTVLTHLAPQDGYTIDYVYYAPGGGGGPFMYARPGGEAKIANYPAYQEANVDDYLEHIQVDGTAEGYYELAVLDIMGQQFYLSGFGAYNDWEVVASQERLEAVIKKLEEDKRPLSEEQKEEALLLDPTPRVNLGANKVRVRILLFTKFSGFHERIYTIDRDFPHLMTDEDIELIPYSAGIVF